MKQLLTFLLLVGMASPIWANNIRISNVTLTGQDLANNFYLVEFDLAWDNSWRTNTYESNWDAAWVFVKFTPLNEQNWQHASLHYINGVNDGHTTPPGAIINTTPDGVGVMLYRASVGIGNVNFQNIQLRWDYGGMADDEVVEISVHAIEMVYVPQGAFYLGDGQGDYGQFEAGTSGLPFLVTSENALTLGGGGGSSLGNNNAINMNNADDFNDVTSRSLPAAFPKGYNAFYCMKYEASQQQYADFLSKVTSTQRAEVGGVHMENAVNVFPIINGNYYAKAENPWHAMEYLSWDNVAAYLDWAGLRPMSELEYEKACRGPEDPVPNEYAWGNASWYLNGWFTYENEGTAEETILEGISTHTGNGNLVSSYQGSGRPVRCGIFAASAINKTRQETGATYWGIMEMTGNCYEMVISIGESNSRDFTGAHGNGSITSSGHASFSLLTDWAFVSAQGVGLRNSEVSVRQQMNNNNPDRERVYGLRGVRTAAP